LPDVKWLDLGTNSADSVDYPDFAGKLADAIKAGKAGRGILICGSGIGISIAANRRSVARLRTMSRARGCAASIMTRMFWRWADG
jgi:ribose 5-phosphate isomerase B